MPMLHENNVLYTYEAANQAIPILGQLVPEACHTGVVLSDDSGEGVVASLEDTKHSQLLSQLVNRLALFPEDPKKFTAHYSINTTITVPYKEVQLTLFEHFGNTGELLTPLSALSLAGAVKLARSSRDSSRQGIFVASRKIVAPSPMQQQLFIARARRRASDRAYQRDVSEWPCIEPLESV